MTRLKEVAIRKVAGAGRQHILMLFLSAHLKYIAFAIVVIYPIQAWLLSRWLADFESRVQLGIIHFLLPAAFLGLVVSTVIGAITGRAGKLDPAEVLRRE